MKYSRIPAYLQNAENRYRHLLRGWETVHKVDFGTYFSSFDEYVGAIKKAEASGDISRKEANAMRLELKKHYLREYAEPSPEIFDSFEQRERPRMSGKTWLEYWYMEKSKPAMSRERLIELYEANNREHDWYEDEREYKYHIDEIAFPDDKDKKDPERQILWVEKILELIKRGYPSPEERIAEGEKFHLRDDEIVSQLDVPKELMSAVREEDRRISGIEKSEKRGMPRREKRSLLFGRHIGID